MIRNAMLFSSLLAGGVVSMASAAPDLRATFVSAQAEVLVGGNVTVTWRVTNGGTSAVTQTGRDRIFVSPDTLYGSGDTPIFTSEPTAWNLAPGASREFTATFPVPIGGGNYFLYVLTDADNDVAESDETNNLGNHRSLRVLQGDLSVATVDAPPIVRHGNQFTISFAMRNSGSANLAVPAPIIEAQAFLSRDTVLDDGDELIGSLTSTRAITLAPGSTVPRQIAAAAVARAGNYYVILKLDPTGAVSESNRTNNVTSPIPVKIEQADITITSLVAPSTVTAFMPFRIDFKVKNVGSAPIELNHANSYRVVVSDDPVYDNSDMVVAMLDDEGESLNPDGVANRTAEIAFTTSPGDHYLIVVADADNSYSEIDETNNVSVAVPFRLMQADVAPLGLTAPPLVGRQCSYVLSWQVTNSGNGPMAPRTDFIYLSEDDTLDETDRYLGLFRAGELGPSGSERASAMILPVNVQPGDYYLLVEVDALSAMRETSERNNVAALAVGYRTTPDLYLTGPFAPARLGLGMQADVSWNVANSGEVIADGAWKDRILLSADATLSPDDTPLVARTRTGPLAAGSNYSDTAVFDVPEVTPGTWYLLGETDADNNVLSCELNNVSARQVTITDEPDLVVTEATVPAAIGEDRAGSATWTVTNQGRRAAEGTWTDRLYVSSDVRFDDTDVAVGTVTTVAGPLAGGTSYTRTANFTIPALDDGTWYLIVRTDTADAVREVSESNNSFTQPFVVSRTPDLEPLLVDAPTTATAGLPITVAWEVKNVGFSSAPAPWTDRLYLSSDASWDAGDTLLASQARNSALARNATYRETVNVLVPTVASKTWFLIVLTDVAGAMTEYREDNNRIAFPMLVESPFTPTPAPTPTSTATPVATLTPTVTPTVTPVATGATPTATPIIADEVDTDRDGLMDYQEIVLGTSETERDTDRDGFEDGVEVAIGTNPLDAASPADRTDADADGIPDAFDNDPTRVDADNDGYRDSYEMARGSSPSDAGSRPTLGEVNRDGVVDFADAVVLFGMVLNNTVSDSTVPGHQLDVNRDGFVDTVDGVILFNWYLDNVPYLPFE